MCREQGAFINSFTTFLVTGNIAGKDECGGGNSPHGHPKKYFRIFIDVYKMGLGCKTETPILRETSPSGSQPGIACAEVESEHGHKYNNFVLLSFAELFSLFGS